MHDNPYQQGNNWYFTDGIDEWGPYLSEAKANKMMKGYTKWLDKGPNLWQQIWWPIRYNLSRKVKQWLAR